MLRSTSVVIIPMFKVNTRDIKEMEADLKTFARKAYPFAARNTINGAAFAARKDYQASIQRELVNRNRFTMQSIRVEQSRSLVVSQQSATVGSIADYMEDVEFGGTKAKRGKKGVSITTGYAAGQQGQQPRTRLARRPNKLANILLTKRRRVKGSRKQKNLVAVKQAAASGNKYVYMDLGRRQGIFKVIGGKRRPRVKMVHDLSKQSVKIPRIPLLGPAVERTQALIPRLYERSLRFQIRKQNLFR